MSTSPQMNPVTQFFDLFRSVAPKGWRVRNVHETYDMRWTNRFNFGFGPTLDEAIKQELSADEMGGIIVFSTDVNATITDANPIVQWFRRQYHTWRNRILHRKKLDTALKKIQKAPGESEPGGYSLGTFFQGRYKSDAGELFSERSLSVEVLFINHRQLVELATVVCGLFNQETVLVRDNHSGKIFLVDRT